MRENVTDQKQFLQMCNILRQPLCRSFVLTPVSTGLSPLNRCAIRGKIQRRNRRESATVGEREPEKSGSFSFSSRELEQHEL